MQIKELEAEYTYEYDLDIVNIKVKKDYIYRESIDFDVGVFLDFDDEDFPVNLEIIDASKRMNIGKDFLINPSGNVNICINSNRIELKVQFENDETKHVLEYTNILKANLNITDSETNFALV